MKKVLLFVFFALGTIACTGFRMFQLLNMIEPETGFYYSQYNGSGVASVPIIGGFLLAVFLLGLFVNIKSEAPIKKSVFIGIISVLMAVPGFFLTIGTALGTGSLQTEMWKIALNVSSTLLFSLFMVFYGYCCIAGVRIPAGLCVIPVLFAGLRFAITFLGYFGLAKTTDIVIEIMTLALSLTFWHFFGKYTAGIRPKSNARMITAFGLCAAMMCFASTVPAYYVKLFMPGTEIRCIAQNMYFDLATGVYIVLYVIGIICNDKAAKASAEKNYEPVQKKAEA